jgi:hypothetical protein
VLATRIIATSPTGDAANAIAVLARMEVVMATYAPTGVLNMDETIWRLIYQEMSTIANIGADGVECFFQREAGMCLTAIANVDAAGGKVPPWVLCKGKREHCQEGYRDDPRVQKSIWRGELVLPHQPNGRTSALVASDHLHWLRSRIQCGPIVVLWDLFSSHREQGVKERAKELGIELVFIPAGMTSEYQLLDRRIFGSLKARTRAQLTRHVMSADEKVTMSAPIGILLDAWRCVGDEEVFEV